MKGNVMLRPLSMLLMLIPLISILQCSHSGTSPDDMQFIFPDSNISFIDHIQPMFEVKCGTASGCHSPGNTEIRFTYSELISRIGVINHRLRNGEALVNVPIHQKNPESAPLYLILLEGYPNPEDRMPPFNREALNDNQINGIRQWIKEGAPE